MASLDDLMRLGDPDEIRATITRLRAENERLTAECEELMADVVWAVKHGALYNGSPVLSYVKGGVGKNASLVLDIDCDGTPADILRAVREARNGVS